MEDCTENTGIDLDCFSVADSVDLVLVAVDLVDVYRDDFVYA